MANDETDLPFPDGLRGWNYIWFYLRGPVRRLAFAAIVSLAIAIIIPLVLISIPGHPLSCWQDHTGFAPWEAFPEQGGVRYIDTIGREHPMDPMYVAYGSYETDADIKALVDAFGLAELKVGPKPES